METADYKIGMLKKQQLYQQEGKRLISLHPADKPCLDSVLRETCPLWPPRARSRSTRRRRAITKSASHAFRQFERKERMIELTFDATEFRRKFFLCLFCILLRQFPSRVDNLHQSL
jgi:hypothetical protein